VRGHGSCDAKDFAAPGEGLRLVVPRNGETAMRLRLPAGAARPATRKIHWNDYPQLDDDEGPWSDGEIVRSLPPGTWTVDVVVDGYVTWHRSDVEVLPGRRTDLAEIALDPGLPLTGRIVDERGRGVARTIFFIDDDLFKTDAVGSFKVDHAAAGDHEVKVLFSPDFLDATAKVVLAKDTTPLVLTLRRGMHAVVTLSGVPREASDEFNVTATPSGRGAAPVEDLYPFWPGPDGKRRFHGRFAAGPLRITVRRGEEIVATKDIEVREGEDASADVVLSK
jgi:hypothetical protein